MLDFSTICLLIHFPWCPFSCFGMRILTLVFCIYVWILFGSQFSIVFCILVNFLVFLQDKELLRKPWEEKDIHAMPSPSRLPFCHSGNLFIVCTDLSLRMKPCNRNGSQHVKSLGIKTSRLVSFQSILIPSISINIIIILAFYI